MKNQSDREASPKTLLDAMRDESGESTLPLPADSVQQTTVRLPIKVEKEIKRIAEINGVSMCVIVVEALDRILRDYGRASVSELAPWAASYYRRDRRNPHSKEA